MAALQRQQAAMRPSISATRSRLFSASFARRM
jgi:hypothetical protein